MNFRKPKSRTTDFRPPGANASRPLERVTARPGAAASGDRIAKEHDDAIATYSPKTLIAAAKDLNARNVWDKKDPEHRWVMNRRAALLRRIAFLKLSPADA